MGEQKTDQTTNQHQQSTDRTATDQKSTDLAADAKMTAAGDETAVDNDPTAWIGALAPYLDTVAKDPGIATLLGSLDDPTAVDEAAIQQAQADDADDASQALDLHRRTVAAAGIRLPLAAALAQHRHVVLVAQPA